MKNSAITHMHIKAHTHTPLCPSVLFHQVYLYPLYYGWLMNLTFYLAVSKCSLEESSEFVFRIWFALSLFDSKGEYSVCSVWLSSALFDPPPPQSLVPSPLLNLSLQLNEVGPLPLISFITVKWLFMFDLIASTDCEFIFDLPSQKAVCPNGSDFIGLIYLIHAEGELPKSVLSNRQC